MEDWEVVRRTDLYDAVWKTLLDMAGTAEKGSITPGIFARVAFDTCLTDAKGHVEIGMTESERSGFHAKVQKTLDGIVESAYGAVIPQTFARVAVDVAMHELLEAGVITPAYTPLDQLVEAKADALTAHLRRKGLLP